MMNETRNEKKKFTMAGGCNNGNDSNADNITAINLENNSSEIENIRTVFYNIQNSPPLLFIDALVHSHLFVINKVRWCAEGAVHTANITWNILQSKKKEEGKCESLRERIHTHTATVVNCQIVGEEPRRRAEKNEEKK